MYEPGRHVMPEDVLENMVKSMLELRFPQTVFAWQGGEPTLAGLDFYRKTVDFIAKYGEPGQSVGNALQTNGVLLDEEWCKFMHEYHFLVGLSLDGPEEIHNKMRVNAAGAGTWSKVMESASLMDKERVEFNILCVVNKHNIGLGADLLRWFVDNGYDFIQFISCLEPGMEHSIPPELYGDFLIETFDYWISEGLGKISIRDFDALLSTRAGAGAPLCTFGKICNHYIVIEHNGDVYPCDFFVYKDWKLGNIMEAPIESFMQTEKYREFSYQKNKVPKCRGCKYRTICYGGCPKDRLFSGSVNEPTPLCEAYKKFFAHALPKLDPIVKRVSKQHGTKPQPFIKV